MLGFIISSTGSIRNLGELVYGTEGYMIDEAIPVVSLPSKDKDKGVFGVINGIEPPGEINVGFGHI